MQLKSLPPHERPRERMALYGAKALSDRELLAVILGSGTSTHDVMSIADRALAVVDRSGLGTTVDQLAKVPGIGVPRAAQLVAALEFSRRRIAAEGIRIRCPRDVVPLVQHLADRRQETFVCISLSGAHEVIASRIVTIGLANVCQVHPREVFADPITDRACAVVVAHNHPSGDLTPSEEDLRVTERLDNAAKLLGIRLLDHIIFSRRGVYSIRERSLQPQPVKAENTAT